MNQASDIQESSVATNSEFGSWATDSRSQTNFVKTSETLNLKKIQQLSNVLSTAILNEGESLGLSPELCQDLIVLLSGPRVKTLSWDMDKEILVENCRSYMERTQGGTRALTTELKYLNLNPDLFMHLPEEMDDDEGDIYYGIEKGYEHLVELQEPEEIWEHVLSEPEKSESCYSTEYETFDAIPKGRKKGKPRRHSFSAEEEPLDPLGDLVPKTNQRSYSNERKIKEHSKERSKERKKKEGQSQDRSNSSSKSKSSKDIEKSKNTNVADVITVVDMIRLQQKSNKERKNREKKDLQKQTPTPTGTGLSRLVGKKIIKPNLLKSHEQIRKREIQTVLNNQIFISDSGYDSQEKSSIASVHTEENDPDVLFDGLFTMDDIKSPEKTMAMPSVKTNPLQLGSSTKRKSLVNNAIKATTNISKTSTHCHMVSNRKDKDLTKAPLATPALTKNVNEISQSLPWCSSNSCRNEVDEVKTGIKRLIQFRKQKSATDLFSKTKPESELKQLAGQNTRKNKFYNNFGLNRMENESRIVPGSSKAISVPDIPKVFINKAQREQLNTLRNEVDKYLLNQGNGVKSQSHPLNNLKNPEGRHSNEQTVPKSVKSDMSGTHSNLNKFEQKLFNMFHHNESSKVTTSNTPNTISNNDTISGNKHNVTGKNVSTLDRKKLQEFFEELHRSNNAGVSKPNNRIRGITKDTSLYPSVSTNYTAKQIKPSAREENAPNTFARLNYLHKNSKQIDNACKQNVDYITPNKSHKTSPYSPSVKDKNNVIDTLLSRVDSNVMRKAEVTSIPKKVNSEDEGNERLVRSNSLESKPTLLSMLSTTQSTPTSISKPVTTNCNDDQFKNSLQQNSKYFLSRPQIRSEVVMKKEVCNTRPSASPIPLNSQSLSQQLGEDVYNRLQGCPTKIQACQNVPGQTQKAVKIKSRSSSISKKKEVSTNNSTRHQSSVVNNEESKSDIKKGNIPQDWESVLNDLLSHKTPSRGLNTQDLVLKKDKQMPSNNLRDQRVNHLDFNSKTNYNMSVASGKLDKEFCNKTCRKQNKRAIQRKINMFEETNKTLTKNNTTSLIYTNNASAIVNQPLKLKSKQNRSTKKPKKTTINKNKRLAKTPEAKLLCRKDLNVSVSPMLTDPVISALLPSSEFDILTELMDDDLRKELGELTSDEESLSASNVASKRKVKCICNKVNMLGNPNFVCNLNVCQNSYGSNNQTVSILQSDMEGPEAQASTTITGYETLNVIKSKPLHNTVFLHNDENIVINQAQEPCMPSIVQQHHGLQYLDTNNSITNESMIIDSMMTSDCSSLDCNIQQSGVNCSNQNFVSGDIPQGMLVNMNNENVFSAAPQQHTAVKKVVLIRPEIVYEPYSAQVHQIPNTTNSTDCNLNSNTFVELNTVPTISMFGEQFASPVVNPLLIGETMTVPISQKATSMVVNNGNNNNSTCSNIYHHAANGANISNMEEKYYSLESNHFNKDCLSILDDNTIIPQSHSLNEEITDLDEFVNSLVNDSTSGNVSEGNALTVVPERQTVQIPYAIQNDVKEPEKPSSTKCRHSNDLNSTSLPLLNGNLQTIDDSDFFNSGNDIRLEDYFMNYDAEKKEFYKLPENSNVNDTSAKCEMRDMPDISDISDSYFLNENCTMLDSAVNSCPKTDVEVSDVKSGLQSNMPDKLKSESSKSHPLSECCTMVNDVISPYSKAEGEVNDVVSNKKCNERELVPKLQENSNLTPLNVQSTGNKLDQKTSAEYSPRNNGPSKIQSFTLYSNPNFLTGQCTSTADSINDNFKCDVKLNESPSNKNCERRVLTEVQEKLKVVLPEKTVSKVIISEDEESKKELLKAREERMIRKKTAILNRQCHIISDVEPIPLTYASDNRIEAVPDYLQEHNVITGTDDSVNNKKTQTFTVYTNNCSTTNDLLFDKIDICTDKLLQYNPIETDNTDGNMLQSVHTDSSKENNGSNTIDCVLLRSSIKEVDNMPILPQYEKNNDNNCRTHLRRKVKKTDHFRNGNKSIATKKLTKQNGNNITSKKTKVVPVTKDVNSQNLVMPVTSKTLDIEEHLLTSVISKQDSIGNAVNFQTELLNNKDNVESNITVSSKNYASSVNDYESYNGKSGDEVVYKTKVLKPDGFETDIINKDEKLENVGTKYTKQAPLVNSKVSCDPIQAIKNGARLSTELNNLNYDNSNVNENEEISMNIKQLREYGQRVSAGQQQVNQNVNSCESEGRNFNLPTRGKSCRETLDDNKFIGSNTENIIIDEPPKEMEDDRLKRSVNVKLSNGNNFNVTVTANIKINLDSLLEDPYVKSMFKNKRRPIAKHTLNVQNKRTVNGRLETRVILPKPKDLETINLISDDEEEISSRESQVLNTEFGKYKIRGLNDNDFNGHQRKLSQKCYVKVEKCNIPNQPREIVKSNEVEDVKIPGVTNAVNKLMQPQNIKLHEDNNLSNDKNIQVKEIDDTNNKSPNRLDIQTNIKELKEKLLKDLCVDAINKTVDTNTLELGEPIDIATDLQNFKGQLLKDLCDDLENIENEKRVSIAADVVSDLNGFCHSTLKSPNVFSTNSDIKSTEDYLKNTETICKSFSTIKDNVFVDPVSCMSVCALKSVATDEPILPSFKNKLISSKKCQLIIEKCDGLAKKYQLMQSKRCVVSLERCDSLIPSGQKSYNSDNLFYLTEIEASNCNLQRCGSFSILNELDLCDQTVKLFKPTERNINDKLMLDKRNTQYEKIGKRNDSYTCQSDWLMTKPRYHWMLKQIFHSCIATIPDDISTDCESDHDENCSYFYGAFIDGIESGELPEQNILYKVPTLLQIALKFYRDADEQESHETKFSRTNRCLTHLKRKLCLPENTLYNFNKQHKCDNELLEEEIEECGQARKLIKTYNSSSGQENDMMKCHTKYLRNSDSCSLIKMLNCDCNSKYTQPCKTSEKQGNVDLNENNGCLVYTNSEKENFVVSTGIDEATNVEMSSIVLDRGQIRNNDNKTKYLSQTKTDVGGNLDFLISELSTLIDNKKMINGRIETKKDNIDMRKNLENKLKSPNMGVMQQDVHQVKREKKVDIESQNICSKQVIPMDRHNKIHKSQPQGMTCKNQEEIQKLNSLVIYPVISSQIAGDATSNKEDSSSSYYNSDVKSKISTSYETLDSGGGITEPQIRILTRDKCSYTILTRKRSPGNDKDPFEHDGKRIIKENDLRKNHGLPVPNEDKTEGTSYNIYKDVREDKMDGTLCPKNITLLYENDSRVLLKGSIITNPIVGTCYVFPVIKTDIQRPVVNNNDDKKIPDIRTDLFKDTDLIVTKPIVTYSKRDSNFKYGSKNFTACNRVSRRNTKRKIESVESKITYKKYRKGKNIDHPKGTVTAAHDFCYSKEFKNLSNYCDSIKFSYTKQYHLIQLDDVHTLLKDWPIKEESNLSTSNVIDTDCSLFIDIDQRTSLPDPMEQTLAEEILAIYEEKESTSPVINETNFSMGFGERSGRVEQNFIDGKESIQMSAVTLSDVKHSQPFLQSVDYTKSNVHDFRESKEKQLEILDKCYSYIRLRDQVRSFFRKTTAELNYTWLKDHCKSEKRKSDYYDNVTNNPFDLNNFDFFEPPLIENIVQVVQIGQLPVSTGAQNHVTCDPRVTQVTDASPPQCSVENDADDDNQPAIKAEYTELTTADITLPLMRDYDQHHLGLTATSPNCNASVSNDNITIETEVKIEVLDDAPENEDEGSYDTKDFQTFSNDQITNTDYTFDVNDIKVKIKTEEPDVKIIFEPAEGNVDITEIPETYETQQQQQNLPLEKPDQLAHAMSAAGITTTPDPIPDTAMDLSNSLSRTVCTETNGNNYQRSNITAMALQHALAQILPSSVNQPTESESSTQVSVASQILHIVHGKNASVNQLSLSDNTQQSVISTATPTPVLHIVQSKNGPTSSSSNGSPVHSSNSYSGLSLVDTGLSQGGNQLLQIVNTGNQKSNNAAQLLKRVNLLTNLTNVQGPNEQKMVQFVCKSADSKGIQLNTNQRSMVLRLHTVESPQSTSKPECQDQSSSECPMKESVVPQELKSRSVYEENYAKFIQNSKQPVIEKSTSLPKFNQAFGKPVFQEDNQKPNDIETSNVHLSSEDNNIESNDCQTTDNNIHLDNIRQIASPPLLLRKPSTHTTAQQNLVQQIKQAITPMNIQTMHGGVIYTRQIPVNIGGGQTINLITVPSTDRIDESSQKQKTDVRSRSEIEQSIIKIVPQSLASSNSEVSTEETGVSSENSQNSQASPMLTQMRIKLPMLSKNPQMVSAARVVRPSFFQIQRNVIGGPNQSVYQQLVLTAAPTLGQQSIRLPHAQTSREIKLGSESQTSPESQMSSSTLEQLREFDMVLEQVKERSTVQPNGTPNHDISKSHNPSTDKSDNVTRSTPSEVTQQILYSIGNNQSVNVAYVNRKSTVVSTPATTSFARSPDSSSVVESSTSSSHAPSSHASHTVTSEPTNGTHSHLNHHKVSKVTKSKSRPKSHHPQFKMNSLPPKPSNQKPIEDEQTTQRILYILAEYKEQVENSPDKDKPAPRRRTNLQASVTSPGGSKRKKSGSRRTGRDSSPLDDNCRTMGSEDSSCGTSQGDYSETCQELHSPQGSPRKVPKKLSFDQDPPTSQSRTQPQQTQPPPQPLQSQIHKQSQPQLQRNVLVTDGPTIAVTRAAPGKPATAVLMPANYILPVSMVKSGQQIAIVTNRGPKILTLGGGEGGATNALLLQRLISPSGLKPVLARPGVRHVRLPTAALHNLQAFNLATAASARQPAETVTSPVPATSPPQLIDAKAPRSSWTSRESEAAKPEKDTSLERPERVQEPEPEPQPEPDPDPEPWNVPHDYSYEETVRTEMDRTVLDAIPDPYSPDMEAQRIFDKMFDVESKKGYIDSQDDSPRCPYDIDASDCDDKAYHQVVQRRDGGTNRHRFISATTLRQKFALMEDELRLQKSLSEECEDLGVDSPSASDLFPEAELLFSSSPAHDVSLHSHTPQPVILNQSNGISKSDLDGPAASNQVISREGNRGDRQADEIDLGLEDVGIVTVSEDGMRATISLDHEEFVRSHPNTTFHSELTEEGEVQPVTLADLKARHITSTIFHAGRAPATVLVTAPQTTVISQATPDGAGVNHVRCSHADSLHHERVTRFDGGSRFDVLNETRAPPNTTSAIIHSTGNATQVIRRVCYERNSRYFLDDDLMNDPKMDDRDTTLESGNRLSPERHSELFYDNTRRRQNRRLDFSSDSVKCYKSPYDENNSTDSSMGVNMRMDSVIKNARRFDRSNSNINETNMPPLRTYPPKRTYHHDGHRTISGRKPEGRFADISESKRRASNRGVVKRGCHCCNGAPGPPKPKKPRQRKSTLDFN